MTFNDATARKIINFFRTRGFSNNGIAAMLGNMYAESGLRSNNAQNSYMSNLKKTDEEYTAAVDSGYWKRPDTGAPFAADLIGYGLCQWTSPGRKSNLYAFAREKQVSISDLDMQLEFVIKELQASYKKTYEMLMSNTDIRTITIRVMTDYERPAKSDDPVKQNQRVAYAEEFYNLYLKETEAKQMKRDNLIQAMRSFDGAKTGNAKHTEILNLYNSAKPLPRNVKMLASYPWCAATVSAAIVKAGLADELPRECSCGKLIDGFKAKGMWVEADNFVPTPGDLIFYDWKDNGTGDCVEGHDHVGMVEFVSNNEITVMEGNKNNAFARRTIKVNGRYIRGFAHLTFNDEINNADVLRDLLKSAMDKLKELEALL